MFKKAALYHSHEPPPLSCLLSFQVLKCCRGPISRFPFRSVMHRVAWRGYERRWEGGGFALSGLPSVLLCPAQKHYNASASDLHLSGAPDAGAGQGTLVVVLCTKSECVPRTAQRLDNCRLNVQSTLIETVVCACVSAIRPSNSALTALSCTHVLAASHFFDVSERVQVCVQAPLPPSNVKCTKSAELVHMLMKHVKSPA